MTIQTAGLAGLAKTNLRQQALTALRRAITSGDLPPATHLVETELSERLQISRGTLREALRQLQQEGLVAAGARGRLAVRTLDTQEILDIFSVRAALEALAVRTLAEADDRDEAVAVLRQAVDRMEASVDDSLEERIEADLDFHRTLCQLSKNSTLLHTWKSLEGSIRMSFMWAGMEKAVGNMRVDRHAGLVDAITTGDPAQASEVVFAHMKEAAANLVS
jgi:DNA-binding GntR family transcriptional regulator